VALWAVGFVRASVRARNEGCGSGSGLTPASQLYKLRCLKTKLKNCLPTDLAHDIEASMPIRLSNNDGHIFFIKLVSHTFPDKEANKRIIYEYILKLEIT
jgi:hypothetical protein